MPGNTECPLDSVRMNRCESQSGSKVMWVLAICVLLLGCRREAGRRLGGMEAERMRQLRVFAGEGRTLPRDGLCNLLPHLSDLGPF